MTSFGTTPTEEDVLGEEFSFAIQTNNNKERDLLSMAKWTKVIYLEPGDLIAVAEKAQDSKRKAQNFEVQFEKIISIEFVGYEQVYDIEVEGTHNFVANGILAHNTYLSGNVGIGTTAPGAKLHIRTTDSTTTPLKIEALVGAQGLPGWNYRKPITIRNTGSPLTDYQILVILNTQELIGQGKMHPEGNDIRFTDSDGDLLPYWLEPGTINTPSTRIWTKVPSIPVGEKTIYLYYGNPNAESQSSVANTFITEIDQLIGAWHFNEGTGTTAFDTSGNNNNGILEGPTWVSGRFGNALKFDGIDDRVRIPENNVLNKLHPRFSVVVWYLSEGETPGGWQCLVEFGSVEVERSHFYQDVERKLYAGWYINGSGSPQYGNTVLPFNQWHQGVWTYDGQYGRIYANGNLDSELNIGEPNVDTRGGTWFGIRPTGFVLPLRGLIDEILMFEKELTAVEITTLFNNRAYTTTQYPGRVLVHKFATPEPSISVEDEQIGGQPQQATIFSLHPGTGNAYLRGNLGIGTTTPTAKLDITGGIITTNIPILRANQTWNATGTIFEGIRLDITDIASAEGSSLLDLRVGGKSKLFIRKDGNIGIGTTTPLRKLSIVDGGVGLDRPATNTLAFYTANIERMRINSEGNVGIGTAAPTEKLTLTGGNFLQTPPSSLSPIGGVDLGTDGNGVYVSGRYAYVVHASITGPDFRIYDISNPSSPTYVGGVDLGTGGNGVYVSGRYAYVVHASITGPDFRIYDISNPSSPTYVGGVDLGTGGNGVYVSGRYAYVVHFDVSGPDFRIYDISNPATPIYVGGVDLMANGHGVYVSGRYAYVVHGTITGPDPEFRIYDISNPASPSYVGGANLGLSGRGVYVSGRYAYVVHHSVPWSDFKIFDISNPSSPTLVGGADLGYHGLGVYVSGRYAYTVSAWADETEFSIYDISNPTSPSYVGGDNFSAYGLGVYVSGRYAYVVSGSVTGPDFRIYDISGIEVTSGMIHSLEAGNLQVRNDLTVYDHLRVGSGLNVGIGGIYSAGRVAIYYPVAPTGNPTASLLVCGTSACTLPTTAATVMVLGSHNDLTTGVSIRARGTITGGLGDVGEYVKVEGEVKEYQAGDLLIVSKENPGQFRKSQSPYQAEIAGVVSETAGIIAGGGDETITYDEHGKPTNRVIMALAGQVPVKVSLENGPISIGDLLTSASSTPGVAMKATKPGRVIGIALESLSETDFENCEIENSLKIENCELKIGKILVFVNPHWFAGQLSENGLLEGNQNQNENNQSTLSKLANLVKSALQDLGLFIENGIARIKELITDRITTKEIQITDKATGEIYCTWIENGQWQKVKGECDKISNNPTQPNNEQRTTNNEHSTTTQSDTEQSNNEND